MAIEEDIFKAFADNFLAFKPDSDIQWPNVDFNRPDGTYYRFTFLPNTPFIASLGSSGKDRHQGIVQIDCFQPLNTGIIPHLADAKLIAARYAKGTTLSESGVNIRINEPVEISGSVDGETHVQIPVRVRYTADA